MILATLNYTPARGWSAPFPSHLDGPQTLVLAFAAPEYGTDEAPLRSLAAAFPRAVVLGCSTSGEIAGTAVQDASISVAVARFERTPIRLAHEAVSTAGDSTAAGARLGRALAAPDLKAVFLLAEGLHLNGTALLEGLVAELPPGVALSGGLAGDGSRFGETWVFCQGQARPRTIGAVGLYGEHLQVGQGCEGGWADFGPERQITRAVGNVLYELDGQPALDLYRRYLGDLAAGLPGTALLCPLAVRRADAADGAVVRTILGVDESTRSLTFAGDMPQGGIARLMRTQTDRLVDSAGQAGRHAGHALSPAGDSLVVSVSCVGRRLVLGERAEEEVEAVHEGLPAGAAHVGFYSYGEIAPCLDGSVSELHNQTMTVTAWSER